MKYYVYGYTNTGSRDKNEDAVLVGKEVVSEGFREAVLDAPFITAVCDGVGSEKSGETASQFCLRLLGEAGCPAEADFGAVLTDIHAKIRKAASRSHSAENMQTALCALAVDEEGRGLCVNVGSSRLYRFVNGTITQISAERDTGKQTSAQGQEDAADDAGQVCLGVIGSDGDAPQIDLIPLENDFGAEPDDMVIITSDGISDYVSGSEFEVGLSMDLPISEKLAALAKLALLNGSTDNLSIIGIKPFIDFEELSALTRHDAVGETVNVIEMLEEQSASHAEEEKDELSDILTIDLGDIIGKSKPAPEPEQHHDIVSREDIELETHDLFMQAQASLSRLSSLIPPNKKKGD